MAALCALELQSGCKRRRSQGIRAPGTAVADQLPELDIDVVEPITVGPTAEGTKAVDWVVGVPRRSGQPLNDLAEA
jgi:hypothetical protein